jgi:hypothetical protein
MANDRELLKQKIRNTPKRVFLSVYLAVLLGVLLALRGILLRVTAGSFSGKSLLFTVLILGFFAFNGLSLLTKSRLAYILIAIFALPPVLGSLAGAVHLLALLATGEIARKLSETIASMVAVLQLLVIAALYLSLLSRTTRSYVWSSPESGGSRE